MISLIFVILSKGATVNYSSRNQCYNRPYRPPPPYKTQKTSTQQSPRPAQVKGPSNFCTIVSNHEQPNFTAYSRQGGPLPTHMGTNEVLKGQAAFKNGVMH